MAKINLLPPDLGPSASVLKFLNLAKKIKKLTKSNSEFVFKELPKDDPTKRRPDISKARKLLNWKPEINMNDGLIKTINWFKKIKKV